MTSGAAIRLVAVREIRERVRERSFLISTAVSVTIVVLVAVLPSVLGFGDPSRYTVGVTDPAAASVAQAAATQARGFDAEIVVRRVAPAAAAEALADGELDAVLTRDAIRVQEEADDEMVSLLQAANREAAAREALRAQGLDDREIAGALAPPPLAVDSVEPVDEGAEARGTIAFFAVFILYGQLIGYGYFVAMGVVEEKSSRVVEVLLSTLRPSHLLAGKVIGLGILGLGQLLLIACLGLAGATAAGAVEIDGDLLVAVGLALAWFLAGYAFYACAFAAAGALVPRQEELQAATTPLTLALIVSLFVSFGALDDPDGTIAHVTAFIPTTAPLTMPARIALGESSAIEVVAALGVTLAAAALLIPLAARIYSGAVLRTGSAVKLRDAWRGQRPAASAGVPDR